MSDDDLEVYIFQGTDDEKVPESVQKLVINPSAKEVPQELCMDYKRLREVNLLDGLYSIEPQAFYGCEMLLEINIWGTIQYIKEAAFANCIRLAKVQFETKSSTQHQLEMIKEQAFDSCNSLQRIKLPSNVSSIGYIAFSACSALVEAHLSNTRIEDISDSAFEFCQNMQTVGLPNTIKRIGNSSLGYCDKLVTVVVPQNSQPIWIDARAFDTCKQLANVKLPNGSTAHLDAFRECDLFHKHYGKDGTVAGLIGRFDSLPVHRMCYDLSATTVQDLRQCILDQQDVSGYLLVDEFGMTPFHVFFSTIEPREELLDVLLDSLPNQVMRYKDAIGRRPLDYLINNWTDETKHLLQKTLQKTMIDPLARWGMASWVEDMQNKVQQLLVEGHRERMNILCKELYSVFEHYEDLEATSILEMVLWKGKLRSRRTSDHIKPQSLIDREEIRCMIGADVVIPTIASWLDIPRPPTPIDTHAEKPKTYECALKPHLL